MVWRSVIAPLAALLALMPVLAGAAQAQRPDRDRGDRGEWELLGSSRVGGFRMDRDTIDVGRKEGRYATVGVHAREGGVFVDEVVVVFGNNDVERVKLRQRLREGERSRPIDLKGRNRFIKRVEITARAIGRRGRHRAIIEIYGEKMRPWNDGWEKLGDKSVDFKVDRDVIKVGRKEGRFAKIALEVSDNDVEFRDLKVFFRRGPPQDVRIRELIPAGGHTRPIDLQGGNRVIERIELVYRTPRGRGRERAEVTVYGLEAAGGPPPGPRPGPPGGRWEELGCGNVGIKKDRDTIKVGRREGRFSAIQLRVAGNDVNIIDLKVVYDRGKPDDIRVRSLIREGGETRPIDLKGERRVIDRVDLVYKIPLGMNLIKGPARVCVFGR